MRALWDPFFTDEALDLIGLRAVGGPQDGTQGRIWLLEGGRVLKLTTSPDEAAAALAILDAPSPHPSLARVDAVHWVPYGTTFSRDRVIYAVLREEMPAVAVPPHLETEWLSAFDAFRRGWERGSASALSQGLERWRPHGTELDELLDCLGWMRDTLGIRLLDLQPGNVGRLPGRGVAPRDLGVGDFPETHLDRVRDLRFEPLPGLEGPSLRFR